MKTYITLITLVLWLSVGCGGLPVETPDADDAGVPADWVQVTDSRSLGHDAGREAAVPEASTDAGLAETGSDAGSDTGHDAGLVEIEVPDAGVPDAGSVGPDPHALRIVLTWTAANPGDLDLHVHNGDTSRPWYSPADVYYANRTPSWGAVFDGPDSTMFGPEVTRIEHPVAGEVYTVGVQALSFSSVGGRATVEVYCGGALVSTTSTIVNVSSGNECDLSPMYRLVSIVGGGCEATPIGTRTTGASACMAF